MKGYTLTKDYPLQEAHDLERRRPVLPSLEDLAARYPRIELVNI